MNVDRVGFRRIELKTSALAALAEFYGQTLGLPTRVSTDALHVRMGATDLAFQAVADGRPTYHLAMNIPENLFGEARDWLTRRTPALEIPQTGSDIAHFESWNAHAIYFYDPAGNLLELIARHNLANAVNSEFSAGHLLYVSELGLPVHDVDPSVRELGEELGLSPYRPPMPDFAAVGDEHALLILAKVGRTWFGTADMPATPFPARAEIWGSRSAQAAIGDVGVKVLARG